MNASSPAPAKILFYSVDNIPGPFKGFVYIYFSLFAFFPIDNSLMCVCTCVFMCVYVHVCVFVCVCAIITKSCQFLMLELYNLKAILSSLLEKTSSIIRGYFIPHLSECYLSLYQKCDEKASLPCVSCSNVPQMLFRSLMHNRHVFAGFQGRAHFSF